MSLTAAQLHDALQHALSEYNSDQLGQAWALPVAVLVVDQLVPHLTGAAGHEHTLCVAGMTGGKKNSDATPWRNKIAANKGRRYLKHVTIDPHEVMVDMMVLAGSVHPYNTLLTAESEGNAGHGQHLDNVVESTDNGFRWDFFKLLIVPSPVRLMFTFISEQHRISFSVL